MTKESPSAAPPDRRARPEREGVGLAPPEIGKWYVHVAVCDVDPQMTSVFGQGTSYIARTFTVPRHPEAGGPVVVAATAAGGAGADVDGGFSWYEEQPSSIGAASMCDAALAALSKRRAFLLLRSAKMQASLELPPPLGLDDSRPPPGGHSYCVPL